LSKRGTLVKQTSDPEKEYMYFMGSKTLPSKSKKIYMLCKVPTFLKLKNCTNA